MSEAPPPANAPPRTTPAPPRRSSWLDVVERLGNRLPQPATLFAALGLLVLIASWLCESLGVTAIHPKDGARIVADNLLDREGVRRIFTEAVRNFVGFAPLGTVLVAMLGIGLAEASGLIAAALRAFVLCVPRGLLTAGVVFAGVNANLAADAGIIVLPPLAAMLFMAVGRHPLAGIAAAFAGVAGGFSANMLPSTLDVLLAGLTQEAVDASRLLPGYRVNILGNYWFLIAATPVLTALGTWVTHRFVEPRLGAWRAEAPSTLEPLSPLERKGLAAAGLALVASLVAMALLTLLPGAPLMGEGASILERLRPFFEVMVVWVFLLAFIPGLAYGIATRSIRNDQDVSRMMGDTMATMGTYIVLAFAAAQFVNWFAWSNLGAILAIRGADAMRELGLHGGPLLASFVLLTLLLDLFTVSATAKWAVVAPIFVPMFTLLGFTPEATQAAYRVGDSCANVVTPLMPYMPFIITYVQRYDPKAGTGTIVSMMLPYTLVFLVAWTTLLLVFFYAGWPIGPGTPMRMP